MSTSSCVCASYLVTSNAFGDPGTRVPVNTAALLPALDDPTTVLTNATLTQFLSRQFGVAAGKFSLLDLAATAFYGDYCTQFLSTAFNFPPTIEQMPLSKFGGVSSSRPRVNTLLSGLVVGPISAIWAKHSTML